MKNSNDTIWNRTSDLPICSPAPLPLCYRGLQIFAAFVGSSSLYRLSYEVCLISGRDNENKPINRVNILMAILILIFTVI